MRAWQRHRPRLVLGGLALVVMAAVAAARRQPEPPAHLFRITLGLRDAEPTDWSGRLAVRDGEVAALAGWRFDDKDKVEGTNGWKCRTKNYIAPEARFPLQPATGQRKPAEQRPWPNGVYLTLRGSAPAVTVTLPQGQVAFRADEVRLAEPKDFLDGRVRVERLPLTSSPRPPAPGKVEGAVQDDYPAFWVRYRTGKHYLAWVAYQKEKDRVLLAERDGPDGKWSEPVEVAGAGDHFRVALANLHDDTIWVVWSSQRNHNWDLYGRPYKDGKLGDEVRLTDAPGPDIWHRMTTDGRGRAWLVWQGFRDGQSDIFARCADTDGWHEPVKVSRGPGRSWDPCVAADTKEDRVWIGWDQYNNYLANYAVCIRSISGGREPKLGDLLLPDKNAKFHAHISLACDNEGGLWAAWDTSGEQWGKDTGYLFLDKPFRATRLYESRAIQVQRLINGEWQTPIEDFTKALPPEMREYNELPQLQSDREGRIWLGFRHRTARNPRADGWAAQGRWDVYAIAYLGDRWLPPVELPHSAGRNDMRLASQRDTSGNVFFAYASDHRGWVPPGMAPRNHSISVTRLSPSQEPAKAFQGTAVPLPGLFANPPRSMDHPDEVAQVARIRAYKVEAGGKTYRIYRGDLHRHTDISQDGMGDGSLMDLHRYALDAAALDFILVGDHNMGGDNEYSWWRTQKVNDLYTVPGAFLSMYGYERSVPYPNGHRNVIWTERGHRTLPLPKAGIPKQMADDTDELYAYLRRTGGICTLHTSATGQGTNWEQPIDGELEPFVELFQGFHASYEAPGAPRIVDEKSDIIHTSFKPDGYVSRALAKGYRLGFQASSDHVSTHVSYCCVLAEEFSRKGLVDAMRKRHTYAATDNIVLDVRMGAHALMGDEVRTERPRLDVVVLGTRPIERVDVIRDGGVAHTERPSAAEARFRWEDAAPRKGEKPSYYYVRVLQKDGQMAWASPIWVR
jgi:hypothetical protein